MLRVGITGGIGSGKTVVCQVFATLGVPVFFADNAARYLMENDEQLISGIRALLGDDVYTAGGLNREKVSAIIYSDPGKREQLNALVHPATIRLGQDWLQKQQAPYVLKEAAIFFESGSYKDMDLMMGVYAPKEVRIERAMKRGNLSREQVLAIMSQQMDEDEKMKRCDYVVTNDNVQPVIPQVLTLHDRLSAKAGMTNGGR
jgi:dephospho-CoA kinase